MPCAIEVLFTPAEFRALRDRDLSQSVCVVFDVLRATSTFVTALAHGAAAIIPVEEIPDAMARCARHPELLLAGERDGLRIGSALTGGREFDFGNSPREFTPERVRGRTIVSTTTNGTRALRACGGARSVVVGSFLNLTGAALAVQGDKPLHLLLVCAGTGEAAALEDALAAGALCEELQATGGFDLLDSALIARKAYWDSKTNLAAAVGCAQNARRLRAHPELCDDVDFCLQRDRFGIAPRLDAHGAIGIAP